MMMMEGKPEVVLVTGSTGCLGQHIVSLLQDCDDNIAEVRLYDRRPFYNRLGIRLGVYEEKKMTEYFADIRNPEMLLSALEGVDCVIHCAAVVDTTMVSNTKSMWLNNVEGTKAVIDACLKKNVSRLIFASTSAVCCGKEEIFFKSEHDIIKPSSFVLGEYAKTKSVAEDLVLEANGKFCADGETVLRTISLRPVPFFGECDVHFIPTFLRYVNKTMGYYVNVWSPDQRLQICYVGNAAWAFLKAKDKLAYDASVAGEVFFINDDTLPVSFHKNMQPFLLCKRFGVCPLWLPRWLAVFVLRMITLFVLFLNLFFTCEVDLPSVRQVNYICKCFIFNRAKSFEMLDYHPIFTPREAIARSLLYYAHIQL